MEFSHLANMPSEDESKVPMEQPGNTQVGHPPTDNFELPENY